MFMFQTYQPMGQDGKTHHIPICRQIDAGFVPECGSSGVSRTVERSLGQQREQIAQVSDVDVAPGIQASPETEAFAILDRLARDGGSLDAALITWSFAMTVDQGPDDQACSDDCGV